MFGIIWEYEVCGLQDMCEIRGVKIVRYVICKIQGMKIAWYVELP